MLRMTQIESVLLSMQHSTDRRKKRKPTIRRLRHVLLLFPSQPQPWPVYGPPVTSNTDFIKIVANLNGTVIVKTTRAETNSKFAILFDIITLYDSCRFSAFRFESYNRQFKMVFMKSCTIF